jgi:hypothetical protein
VRQTIDEGFIIAGSTNSFSLGNSNLYLIKTNKQGDEEWSYTYGGLDIERGYSVIETNDNGYVVSGSSGSNSNKHLFILKTDSLGSELWSQTIVDTTSFFNEGYCIREVNNNGFIVTGMSFDSNDQHLYLLKVDSIGNKLWSKTYNGLNEAWGASLDLTTDGGFVITGMTQSNSASSSKDVYLLKVDSIGDEEWSQTYGGSDVDEGYYVEIMNDGGYLISGLTKSFGSGGYDFYLIKTDSQGNVSSIADYSTSSSNNSLVKIVDLLGRETEPQPNTPLFYLFDDGKVEKKVIIE